MYACSPHRQLDRTHTVDPQHLSHTSSNVALKLSLSNKSPTYLLNLANLLPVPLNVAHTFGPSPSGYPPRSLISATRARARNGVIAISAIEYSPTAKPLLSGSKAWRYSAALYRSSAGPLPWTNACQAGVSLVETPSMKKRARARLTGSAGRMWDCGKRSATNSTRTSDSASLVDAGEGCSGGTGGPP